MDRWTQALGAAALGLVAAPLHAQQDEAINRGMDYYDREQYAEALPYFVQACDGGDSLGCHNLAYMYDLGLGVAEDFPRAVELYRRACDGGTADGCTGLGFMYENGRGIPVDTARAADLYRQACDAGDPWGCNNLASYYEDGIVVPQDLEVAFDLYLKAATLDPPDDLIPLLDAAMERLEP